MNKNVFATLIIVGIGVFGFANPASAATRYVDVAATNGDTLHGGTGWSDAWQTIGKAESTANAGDMIRVKTGTYTVNGLITFDKNLTWFADNGNTTTGSVILRNSAAGGIAVRIGQNSDNAISWTGFTFDGQGVHSHVAFVDGASTSARTFTDCTFTGGVDGYNLGVYGTHTSLILVRPTFSGSGYSLFYDQNTPATITNPTFSSLTAGSTFLAMGSGTAQVSITGGSATINNASSFFLNGSSGNLTMSGFTLTYSGSGNGNTIMRNSGGANLDIQHSTFNTGSGRFLIFTFSSFADSPSGTITFKDNIVNAAPTYAGELIALNNFNAATVIDIEDNQFTFTGTDGGNVLTLIIGTQTAIGGVTFKNNTIHDTNTGSHGWIFINNVTGNVNIEGNDMRMTGIPVGSHTVAQGIGTLNVTNLSIQKNFIYETAGTGTLIIADASGALVGGAHAIAYIRQNVILSSFASHGGSSYVIQVGTDGGDPGHNQTMTGSIIEHNYLFGPGFLTGTTDLGMTHTILMGYQKRTHVRYNVVWGFGYGLVLKDFATDMGHVGGAYGNIIIDCLNSGILLKGVNNWDVFNNLIYSRHNFQYLAGALSFGGNSGHYPTGNHLYNNIVVTDAANSLVSSLDDITGSIFRNNIYWNWQGFAPSQNFKYQGSMITSLAYWQSQLQTGGMNDTSIFADPKLTTTALNSMAYTGNPDSYVNFSSYPDPTTNPIFNPLFSDAVLNYLSPAIDAGSGTSLTTTDSRGNSIYGSPDAGPLEYQPPYTMGVDALDRGGNARAYAGGKFRYTHVPSGSTGALSVTPSTGYVDIAVSTWNKSGDYAKEWTESGSVHNLSSVHTVGNLEPAAYYNVDVDGVRGSGITGANCSGGRCLADANGVITFTYSGGYSQKTFDVTRADTTPPTGASITPPITALSTTELSVSASSATDSGSGLDALPYQFQRTGATASDWQAGTTLVDSGLSPNTRYGYRIRSRDVIGNVSAYSATSSGYTLASSPTSFREERATATGVTLSVGSFPNSASGSSGYFFSLAGGNNSGWITTNGWTSSNLSCGSPYTFTVKERNGDGIETDSVSLTGQTKRCGSDTPSSGENGGSRREIPTLPLPYDFPKSSPSSTPSVPSTLQQRIASRLAARKTKRQTTSVQSSPSGSSSPYRVKVPLLNLRADARTSALSRGILKQGTPLTVIRFVQNTWAEVRLEDGRTGFVYAPSLEKMGQ